MLYRLSYRGIVELRIVFSHGGAVKRQSEIGGCGALLNSPFPSLRSRGIAWCGQARVLVRRTLRTPFALTLTLSRERERGFHGNRELALAGDIALQLVDFAGLFVDDAFDQVADGQHAEDAVLVDDG